jgi:hypothetical protein
MLEYYLLSKKRRSEKETPAISRPLFAGGCCEHRQSLHRDTRRDSGTFWRGHIAADRTRASFSALNELHTDGSGREGTAYVSSAKMTQVLQTLCRQVLYKLLRSSQDNVAQSPFFAISHSILHLLFTNSSKPELHQRYANFSHPHSCGGSASRRHDYCPELHTARAALHGCAWLPLCSVPRMLRRRHLHRR